MQRSGAACVNMIDEAEHLLVCPEFAFTASVVMVFDVPTLIN